MAGLGAWLGERASANWYWISIGAFLLFAGVESVRHDGRARAATLPRWLTHMAVYASGLVLSSAVLPGFVYALVTDRGHDGGIGAFASIEAWGGPWAVLAAGLLGIDLLVYWAHRLEHRVHLLWRFHAVHHADPDMDVSTALLHHPVAYLFTAGLVGFTMLSLGAPAWVFAVYSVFEVSVGAFQHVATPIPDWFERGVRWAFVTPGMHQVHHSADVRHHDSNYANVLSVWDRLFGTFVVLDAAERVRLRFGVDEDGAGHGLAGVLTRPFRVGAGRVGAESGEPRAAQPIQ